MVMAAVFSMVSALDTGALTLETLSTSWGGAYPHRAFLRWLRIGPRRFPKRLQFGVQMWSSVAVFVKKEPHQDLPKRGAVWVHLWPYRPQKGDATATPGPVDKLTIQGVRKTRGRGRTARRRNQSRQARHQGPLVRMSMMIAGGLSR